MGKAGEVFDTIGKWIVLTPVIGLVVAGAWLLTAPGDDLSRRAFAEQMPATVNGVLSAVVHGRHLFIQAYLDCPAALSASTQMSLEHHGFQSARCAGPNGVRIYDLPFPVSPWFYMTLGAGAVGFVRARRAKSAAAPTPPA